MKKLEKVKFPSGDSENTNMPESKAPGEDMAEGAPEPEAAGPEIKVPDKDGSKAKKPAAANPKKDKPKAKKRREKEAVAAKGDRQKSPEKRGKRGRMGLRSKIIWPASIIFAVSVAAILATVITMNTRNTNSLSQSLMSEMNSHYAAMVQGKVNAALDSARALRPVFVQKVFSETTNRERDTALLRNILSDRDDVFGIYTVWEPNAYDKQDKLYAGIGDYDAAGRYAPWVYQTALGIGLFRLEDYDTADYYQVPKATRKEAILDPYIYQVKGEDKFISSMVVPIEINYKFAGIVGMDILVDSLITGLPEATLFETGHLFLVDSAGNIFYHHEESQIGSSFFDVLTTAQNVQVQNALATGESASFDQYLEANDTVNRFEITPIAVGQNRWLVCSVVPVSEIQAAATETLKLGIGVGAAALLATIIILALVITRVIRPVRKLNEAAKAIEVGDIDEGLMRQLQAINGRDEIGDLSKSMFKAVRSIRHIADDTQMLSDAVDRNDLSVEIDTEIYTGIYKNIIETLGKLFDKLESIISNIIIAAQQVSLGSEQMAQGAQSLAQGAAEQAGVVEELHSSLAEVVKDAQGNADHVDAANDQVEQAKDGLNHSNQEMQRLLAAMKEINTSANQISGIIKVIEGIAFQTNILALNASVEAARAGSAGRGFAVVAEEVRNLANKSSEAAKQTSELIHNSISAINGGVKIADQVAGDVAQVGEKAASIVTVISEIKAASRDQAQAIQDISAGLNQVSSVVQSNSATAEESAAISEELSAQAKSLNNEVAIYKLKKKQHLD